MPPEATCDGSAYEEEDTCMAYEEEDTCVCRLRQLAVLQLVSVHLAR